jgi:glycosyltransferase involved in cell wall biosynthesis
MGVESSMFVMERHAAPGDATVVAFKQPRGLVARLRRRLRSRRITRDFARYRASRRRDDWFFDDRSAHGGDPWGQLPPCDVVHLHSMARFVDYRAFFADVPKHIPIVRTLHDLSFFTGGCYAGDCRRYLEQCGSCPILGSQDDDDLSRHVWLRKRAAYQALAPGRLHVVAPSQWIAQEARRSSLLRDVPVSVIPLGIDTDVFAPSDRQSARRELGGPISQAASVVLFVANGIGRPEKGFAVLTRALERVTPGEGLLFVFVGAGGTPAGIGVPHQHLAHIDQPRSLARVYSASDILVIPSLQDNFPQVALEGLACGTPVVASAVGGIPEIVRSGHTGRLVAPGDIHELGDVIGELLRSRETRDVMGQHGRRLVVEKYTSEMNVRRHLELYRALTEDLGNRVR